MKIIGITVTWTVSISLEWLPYCLLPLQPIFRKTRVLLTCPLPSCGRLRTDCSKVKSPHYVITGSYVWYMKLERARRLHDPISEKHNKHIYTYIHIRSQFFTSTCIWIYGFQIVGTEFQATKFVPKCVAHVPALGTRCRKVRSNAIFTILHSCVLPWATQSAPQQRPFRAWQCDCEENRAPECLPATSTKPHTALWRLTESMAAVTVS